MSPWLKLSGAFRYRDYRLLLLLTMMGSIAVWMRIPVSYTHLTLPTICSV